MKYLALLAALLWCGSANAAEPVIGSGVYASVGAPPPGYTGPGDVLSGASAFYSCARAYNAAYGNGTNYLCLVRNTVTGETCNILAGTNGYFGVMAGCSATSNGLSLAVFCALSAGTCAVKTMKDQTGNSNDITEATAGDQPSLTVSCLNSLPCVVFNSASITLIGPTFTPATGNWTAIVVGNRSVGTGAAAFIKEDGSNNFLVGRSAVANFWTWSGTGSLFVAANDTVWHAAVGVMKGASSPVNLDGTVTSGTVTGKTTAGAIEINGVASTTIEVTDVGFYDNILATSGQATSLCQNMQAAYVSGNFGAAC